MFSHCRTHDELKAAYRKASMKHHPDRVEGRGVHGHEPPKKPFIDLRLK